MIDIPTALTPAEIALLRQVARGQVVLEAGALLGHSTVVLGQVAARVVSVDPHQGYPHATARTFARFEWNLARHGVAGGVTAVVGDARREFPRHTADGAFLDLTGEERLTEECVAAAGAAGVRWLAIHDYARNGCAGATRVVDRLAATGRWFLTRADTLVVLTRRAALAYDRLHGPCNSGTDQ